MADQRRAGRIGQVGYGHNYGHNYGSRSRSLQGEVIRAPRLDLQ